LFHIHGVDAKGNGQYDSRMTSFKTTLTAEEKNSLPIPPNRRSVLEFPQSGPNEVQIPARFFRGVAIVRVMINGRGLDFQLDSGSGAVFVNSQTIRELGLTQYGQKAMIPEMHVGPLTIHNFAVYSLPFSRDVGTGTEVVGLLGFDFIADATLKIDYKNEIITVISGPFKPPADAYPLPVDLDIKVPVIPDAIGSAQGKFIVDSGSYATMLFPEFAKAHPNDLKDVGSGGFLDWNYPLIRANGVGGSFPVKPIEVENVNLGPMRFTRWPLMEIAPNSVFGGGNVIAGLIGQDLLRFFDVYFDYVDGTVYFVLNKDLKQFKVK